MRRSVSAFVMVGLWAFQTFAASDPAEAEIIVNINKSKQRMAVLVDGTEQHVWKISTGTGGGPPSGTYRPLRLERKWYSRKYNWSPMPHSIFFLEGYAIHGTYYVSRLGRRASHGCVRLHPTDAAALFSLVRSHGMAGTTIIISNSDFVAKPAPELKSSSPAVAPDIPALPASDRPPESTGTIPSAPDTPPARSGPSG
jgi:lipoprotein-anchoring transpeptidase ErfK/SrfK